MVFIDKYKAIDINFTSIIRFEDSENIAILIYKSNKSAYLTRTKSMRSFVNLSYKILVQAQPFSERGL